MKKINTVYEFVISRREWLRGEGEKKSFLWRRRDNKKCCVGIYGKACGLLRKDLIGQRSLHISTVKQTGSSTCLINSLLKLPKQFESKSGEFKIGSKLLNNIYAVNDDPAIDECVREKMVAKLFKRAKIRVKFTK